jgi:hypothetical protein
VTQFVLSKVFFWDDLYLDFVFWAAGVLFLVFGCPELALGGFLDCVKRWFRETASDWLAGGASLLEEVFLTSSNESPFVFSGPGLLHEEPSDSCTDVTIITTINDDQAFLIHPEESNLPKPPRSTPETQRIRAKDGNSTPFPPPVFSSFYLLLVIKFWLCTHSRVDPGIPHGIQYFVGASIINNCE